MLVVLFQGTFWHLHYYSENKLCIIGATHFSRDYTRKGRKVKCIAPNKTYFTKHYDSKEGGTQI
jgi:hypothetical protein